MCMTDKKKEKKKSFRASCGVRSCTNLRMFFSIDKPNTDSFIYLGKQRIRHVKQQAVSYSTEPRQENIEEPWPSYLQWLSSM